jgi:hypothetical protein
MGNDGFVTFLKMIWYMIYWPCRLLFLFVRWLWESAAHARDNEILRQSEVETSTYEQKREQERRSRSTLYGGSPQPDK